MDSPLSVFMFVLPRPAPAPVFNIEHEKSEPEKPKHDHASTQFDLPKDVASKVLELGKKIKDEDLADDGCEDKPHITAFYGLVADTPAEVEKAVKGFGPVKAKLGAISLFQNPDKDFDVVKIEVESRDLHRLNGILRKLPNENEYPDYKPHCTLAYVKRGKGKDYLKLGSLAGTAMEFSELVFSGKDGKKTSIKL
jgi:2'-5' RNA ligase